MVFVLVSRSRRVVPDELVTLTSWEPYHITSTGIISLNGPAQLKIWRSKLADQHENLYNQDGPKIKDYCSKMCHPSQSLVSFDSNVLKPIIH